MVQCVVCGAVMQPHQGDVTEHGIRCRACSMRDEIGAHERRAAEAEVERAERRLTRRAKSAAWAHAVLWSAMGIVFLANTGLSSWVAPFVVVVLGLEVALIMRRRFALLAALAIDGAIVATAFGWALTRLTVDALIGASISPRFRRCSASSPAAAAVDAPARADARADAVAHAVDAAASLCTASERGYREVITSGQSGRDARLVAGAPTTVPARIGRRFKIRVPLYRRSRLSPRPYVPSTRTEQQRTKSATVPARRCSW